MVVLFRDRRDAGRRLAVELMTLVDQRPAVFALPRGGVPVAVEVARALGAPLDILAVRKLGAPGNPELAVGAVAEDGTGVLDPRSASMVGMTHAMLDATLARESRELRRRVQRYRDGRPAIPVSGRTVIVVDDGLATGLSDLAAVRALRKRGAASIVVAAPVASSESVSMLAEEADRVVCLTVPQRLLSVGMWYRDFTAVGDGEVLTLLAEASEPSAAPSRSAPSPKAVATVRRERGGEELSFDLDDVRLAGSLGLPEPSRGLVLFAHGSASSRLSPRNRAVAQALGGAGFATLLFDLLDEHEAQLREEVFDVRLLAGRLAMLTSWALSQPRLQSLPIGYFGASTGAAAALVAAAELGDRVGAVVSRGGRPDLAGDRLGGVVSPTMLIVGSLDAGVLELNRQSAELLRCRHELAVIDGAGHLFEEPGALGQVSELAIGWFRRYLTSKPNGAMAEVR